MVELNIPYYVPNGVGFVEVFDSMGSDLTVSNAARVSFGKRKMMLDGKDERLIEFLGQSDPAHTAPFRHPYISLHIKAPEFIARQWYKHIIGSEYKFKDTPWSEISGRYIAMNSFWLPDYLRLAAANKKQGSIDNIHERSEEFVSRMAQLTEEANSLYKEMYDAGVAPEQARAILPMSYYTEFIWTASLQAVLHFVKLRDHPEAQKEIREYAEIVHTIVQELFPVATEKFKDNA